MSDRGFDSTPPMGQEFGDASKDTFEGGLEHDAQNWEPVEEPSEKRFELHYTPGGALEQEVHAQIDEAARARIIEAQNDRQRERALPDEQELDFAGDFEEARRNAWGWDPQSRQEYEGLSHERNTHYDNDPFETGRRFERGREPERGDDFER
jgi:hypothetical protein